MASARARKTQTAQVETSPKAAAAVPGPRLPLVLDLDGTLIASDVLLECMLIFVKRHPLQAWMLLVWLVQGRAVLKERLAERIELAVELLPEREAIVSYARAAHAEGRAIYLATASDRKIAEAVSRRYPFIREVLASGGRVNLKGREKARALKERFPDGFVYAGDSHADTAVWRQAAGAVFAGPEGWLRRKVSGLAEIEASAPSARPTLKVWIKALRLHQWSKNAVMFAPLILAGRAGDLTAWAICAAGFLAMGLIASATYLVNDLTDLEDDRRHWTKRNRPLAAGVLPLRDAILAVPLMLSAGMAIAFMAGGWAAAAIAAIYCMGTLAYSFGLKRVPLADVMVLAGLFTIRLLFGSVLAQAPPSSWLLIFCMFLFTSLALAKRNVEIGRAIADGGEMPKGRGYRAADLTLITGLGAATAIASVQVMVMYLIEDAFPQGVYALPDLLWGAPVLLGLWLGRIWLLCGRGELDDDPVAFAIKDRISLWLGGLTAGCFLLAAAGWPWL